MVNQPSKGHKENRRDDKVVLHAYYNEVTIGITLGLWEEVSRLSKG